jgi:hypothetical protein
MTISVRETGLRVFDLRTRMPFHFGNVAVTEIPRVFLRIEAEIDGAAQQGTAMGGLVPGWFYKDPDMRLSQGLVSMIDVFRAAANHARALDPESTAFDCWHALYRRQREWATGTDHPPLLWNYGVSLVEQALVDAVCRREDTTFATAVRENTLGIDLGSIYDRLAGYEPADLLPEEPHRSTAIRHTVGQEDPLTDDDLTAADSLDDGLPQTLAEYIREDGVTHFKIKLSAHEEQDRTRLAEIATLLADLGVDAYRCTVDANEGYDSIHEFKRQWTSLTADPVLSDVFDRLLYVEQPLAREDAFTSATRDVLSNWDDAPPIIIDESDAHVDSAGRALTYGYVGTSHKNCKGVFKGIVNSCLMAAQNQVDDDRTYVVSAEDLTTVGPIELVQDLATVATIGADHVERNGHHYFRGLDAFPSSIQDDVFDAHGDLYCRHEGGFPALDIEDGRIDLNSVINAPFGAATTYDTNQFTPVDTWIDQLQR